MDGFRSGDGYIADLITANRAQAGSQNGPKYDDTAVSRVGSVSNPCIGACKDVGDTVPGPVRAHSPPPAYEDAVVNPINVREPDPCAELRRNPLWHIVQTDSRQEHGGVYRVYLGRNPLRRARYMGQKLIALLYFPLLNDVVRFFWSMWKVVILCVIATLQYTSKPFPFPQQLWANGTSLTTVPCDLLGTIYNRGECKYVEDAFTAQDYVVAISTFFFLADFLVCTSYFLHKRLCRKFCNRPQNTPEEVPLLARGVRWTRWVVLANWWYRHSDIPRFKVSEALLISMYYLGLSSRNYFNFSFGVSLVALSQYGLTILLQMAILVKVICYSTCFKQKVGISYRAVGYLSAFITHFVTQLLFSLLLICFSSYIYTHVGIDPALYINTAFPYGDFTHSNVTELDNYSNVTFRELGTFFELDNVTFLEFDTFFELDNVTFPKLVTFLGLDNGTVTLPEFYADPVELDNGIVTAIFTVVIGCFIVPLFSHLTFFTLTYGWLKYACTKTFMDFLNHLNQLQLRSTSRQERQNVNSVLDGYHYEALSAQPHAWNKAVSYLPGCFQITVLGVLLTLLLGCVSFVLYGMWFPSQSQFDLFAVFLALTLLLHSVYIVVAIVWPVYAFIDVVGWCCYKCVGN